MDNITILGAKTHNLKNINLQLPRGKMIVMTGLSGSGKSSLAFDTIYAEGQRRYVESMSAYARQFLDLMQKPDVELIEGLSPAISIQQRAPARNPRSTVATVTEIYDYFRLLYARIGKRYCPECGRPVQQFSLQAICDDILKKFNGKNVLILSPLIQGKKGSYEELFSRLKREGFVKILANGEEYDLSSPPVLARYKKHSLDLIVDEILISPEDKERLEDALDLSSKYSKGLVRVKDGKDTFTYSENNACANCGVGFANLEPRLFSFNAPQGACAECNGLGIKIEIDEDLVIPDKNLSISDGAVYAWSAPVTNKTNRWKNSWAGYYYEILSSVCRYQKIPMTKPWKSLTRKQQEIILYGGPDVEYKISWSGNMSHFEGVINNLKRRNADSDSEFVREAVYERFMREIECSSCHGARLNKEALAVKIGGKNISEVTQKQVGVALDFINNLKLTEREQIIAKQILKEIRARLGFLNSVGLSYLTLNRKSQTLSGGEAQRIHLATQIGSGLTGVLYVLDEPTIGLHSRDNDMLLATLKNLRDLGNTLIIVEHDKDTILSADYIVELGPAAGANGGQIVCAAPLKDFLKDSSSLTAAYLNGTKEIKANLAPRLPSKKWLEIRGATQFNLKNINVKIPLGLFVCITGVSGSGKSTLVHNILYNALAQKFYDAKEPAGKHKEIKGLENINKVIIVDQTPIGKTPRSNPATYTGVFTSIRELFAQMPEAKRRGYKAGRFSFNIKGGRCEKCEGDGIIKIQMQFLPDIYVKCEECEGKRFNEDTLAVKFKGKNIADVLDMTVDEAVSFFTDIPKIKRTLKTLQDVGLGYIKLGQSATTLSGGEAQRVKLADELSRRATGDTLYILDEPTTGLHFADIDKLLNVLHKLSEQGNTVLVIEHNLDIIKTADWIIDLGPEGGDKGGEIVAQGSVEEVSKVKSSYTGQYLAREINLK